jgi:hypothetical protein
MASQSPGSATMVVFPMLTVFNTLRPARARRAVLGESSSCRCWIFDSSPRAASPPECSRPLPGLHMAYGVLI